MIAGVVPRVRPALEVRQRALDERRGCDRPRDDGYPVEAIDPGCGEPLGQPSLILAQDADPEELGPDHAVVGARRLGHAHEDERRRERDGGEPGRREPDGAQRPAGGDDRDPAREVSQGPHETLRW